MKVLMDQDLNVRVLLNNTTPFGITAISEKESISISAGEFGDSGYIDGGMDGMGEMVEQKDPILSSWPFVIGISSITLVVSVVLGLLLAKRKIKKGFELYED